MCKALGSIPVTVTKQIKREKLKEKRSSCVLGCTIVTSVFRQLGQKVGSLAKASVTVQQSFISQ